MKSHFTIHSLLWGTALGVSLYNFPIGISGVSLPFILVPVMGLILAIDLSNDKHRAVYIDHGLFWPVFLYAAFLLYVIPTGYASNQQYFVGRTRALLTLPLLPLVTYFVVQLIGSPRYFYWIVSLFWMCAGVLVLKSALQSNLEARAAAMGFGSNYMGLTLALGALFYLWRAHSEKNRRLSNGLTCGALVLITGTISTASRTAFVSLCVIIIGLLFLGKKERTISLILIVCIVLLLFVIPTQNLMLLQRMESLTHFLDGKPTPTDGESGGLGSAERRWAVAVGAMEWFMENPLLGCGLGGFRTEVFAFARNYEEFIQPAGSHNIYLLLLIETGLIGTALFIGFIVGIFIMLRHIKKYHRIIEQYQSQYVIEQERMPLTSRWMTVGLIAILVYGMGGPIAFERIFWIWISIIVSELAYARNLIRYLRRTYSTKM